MVIGSTDDHTAEAGAGAARNPSLRGEAGMSTNAARDSLVLTALATPTCVVPYTSANVSQSSSPSSELRASSKNVSRFVLSSSPSVEKVSSGSVETILEALCTPSVETESFGSVEKVLGSFCRPCASPRLIWPGSMIVGGREGDNVRDWATPDHTCLTRGLRLGRQAAIIPTTTSI